MKKYGYYWSRKVNCPINRGLNQLAQEKRERINDENKRRGKDRKIYLDKKVGKWRQKTWIGFSIWLFIAACGIIFLLYKSKWQIDAASAFAESLVENIIISALLFLLGAVFTGVTIKTLFNKYRNHPNIEAYKNGIEFPDDLQDLEQES